MAQAFYPTNDGRIGNIEKCSLPELMDLINRQTSLLRKKKFINTLPDKGRKIQERLDILNKELGRRKSLTLIDKNTNGLSSSTNHGNVGAEELEKGFDRLQVNEIERVADKDNNVDDRPKHLFEIAEERSKQNEKDLRQYTRLNQSLKVSTIEELPPNIMATKPQQAKLTQKSVISEESAAVPPSYKYDEAQIIPLDESLHLQKSQKEQLERIQAVTAAQKLSQRLGVKMEKYNPEGIDMSYRGTAADEDSESDAEDKKIQDLYDEGDDVD